MTEILERFHVIRRAVLLRAPVVIGWWWLWLRRSDPLRGWREQIEPELLSALVVGRESARRGPAIWLLTAWLLTAWLLAVVAIAGPTWQLEPSPLADDAAWRNTKNATSQPGTELRGAILALQRHLFGPAPADRWPGDELARAFGAHCSAASTHRSREPASALPELNPRR